MGQDLPQGKVLFIGGDQVGQIVAKGLIQIDQALLAEGGQLDDPAAFEGGELHREGVLAQSHLVAGAELLGARDALAVDERAGAAGEIDDVCRSPVLDHRMHAIDVRVVQVHVRALVAPDPAVGEGPLVGGIGRRPLGAEQQPFAVGGLVLSFLIYRRAKPGTDPLPEALGPIWTLWNRLYYIDDFYLWLVRKVQDGIAWLCWQFERWVIIGLFVNGTAFAVKFGGDRLRRVQAGQVSGSLRWASQGWQRV